ncbi:MAG: hypothetical protein KDD52_01880 [Bdellovibrionales bacterium]|nr:hypothetical protein [Bdellovibrionales bacterium]
MKSTKIHSLLIVMLSLALGLGACKKTQTTPEDTSRKDEKDQKDDPKDTKRVFTKLAMITESGNVTVLTGVCVPMKLQSQDQKSEAIAAPSDMKVEIEAADQTQYSLASDCVEPKETLELSLVKGSKDLTFYVMIERDGDSEIVGKYMLGEEEKEIKIALQAKEAEDAENQILTGFAKESADDVKIKVGECKSIEIGAYDNDQAFTATQDINVEVSVPSNALVLYAEAGCDMIHQIAGTATYTLKSGATKFTAHVKGSGVSPNATVSIKSETAQGSFEVEVTAADVSAN